MRIQEILKSNKEFSEPISPVEKPQALARRFRDECTGALIVRGEGGLLDGIITERDMAYGLAVHGESLPKLPVAALMTTAGVSCSPDDSLGEVAKLMIQRRLYYLPVAKHGRLIGIISIGQVLKYRMHEMGLEANVLRDIAIASR